MVERLIGEVRGLLDQLAELTGRASPAPARPSSTATASRAYYLTGYSWWDNTPPGSAGISYPVLHGEAGGVGSYEDPTTVAVGHSRASGESVPVVPAGTRFYLVSLKRYLMVEDACGDGPTPQNGPCNVLPDEYKSVAGWLDVWVGGKASGKAKSDQCMAALTGPTEAVVNPPPGLPVQPGDLC